MEKWRRDEVRTLAADADSHREREGYWQSYGNGWKDAIEKAAAEVQIMLRWAEGEADDAKNEAIDEHYSAIADALDATLHRVEALAGEDAKP